MATANGWSVAGSNESDGAAQAILRMLNEDPYADRKNTAAVLAD